MFSPDNEEMKLPENRRGGSIEDVSTISPDRGERDGHNWPGETEMGEGGGGNGGARAGEADGGRGGIERAANSRGRR